jgi:hypothetical protein
MILAVGKQPNTQQFANAQMRKATPRREKKMPRGLEEDGASNGKAPTTTGRLLPLGRGEEELQ